MVRVCVCVFKQSQEPAADEKQEFHSFFFSLRTKLKARIAIENKHKQTDVSVLFKTYVPLVS